MLKGESLARRLRESLMALSAQPAQSCMASSNCYPRQCWTISPTSWYRCPCLFRCLGGVVAGNPNPFRLRASLPVFGYEPIFAVGPPNECVGVGGTPETPYPDSTTPIFIVVVEVVVATAAVDRVVPVRI